MPKKTILKNIESIQDSENSKIDFAKIEKKWQKKWEDENIFGVSENSKKDKFYVLEMYPYPSSSGLHMGHAFNYSLGDILARYKRMNGFNVLYPMGFDSFGLPAENASIKAQSHPKKFTEDAIKNYISQMKKLGLSYDWSRLLMSHDPEYYKWNQYFFLQFFKKGFVYRNKGSVNWCSKCNTVLANEQVQGGKCWRHNDTEVIEKDLEQWFIRTRDYAEELLKDVEKLEWPERIKSMQKNWIGKSEGVDIYFKLEGSDKILPAFTTRCDTIYSVTFLAIAPESLLVKELVNGTKYEKDAKKFIEKVKKESMIDRVNEDKAKEGFFTGKYAINPVNNEKIPIYIANFALMYGSGIVMCDAHDKRDFAFAKKYGIDLKFVISPDGKKVEANQSNFAEIRDGILFNSGEFSGMNNREALPKIASWMEKKKIGKKVINYKLRDWLVSRQRYWGTPIPVVYCDACGIIPVPESELPVLLPEKVKFGKGNPLETNEDFLKAKCSKCGGEARRETDTMDTFFDSSWYYLRYCDSKNKFSPFDKNKVNYWMPVDYYIGGAEHACMHLIYARLFTKALRDLGYVKFDEPFKKLFNQGMLHLDGSVMSKSKGNVVLPDEVSEKYGIDTARMFLVSIASPDKDIEWSDKGVEGSYRFINKLMNFSKDVKFSKESSKKVESKLNKTIKEMIVDIEETKYNSVVIKIRTLFEVFENSEVSKEDFGKFIKILAPFCPHIAEEIWEKIGGQGFVSLAEWPKYDESKIDEKLEDAEKAVDKTISDIINVTRIVKEKQGKDVEKVYVYVMPKELEDYDPVILSKRVSLEVKVYAVNDKAKYDPEGKAGKSKPGKPGIYVE
ncbi:leucine--tRNA ligase [Candidatus Pacearchaeota archaeon CG10_big_fil_rev_8_21_14_0_10_31_24]|nr:MAG: leucine--tRNA ligase [Candidatus Pacearchaeota archaeon CG10_big_fil_rev_8_21_14_0_10_31_24]